MTMRTSVLLTTTLQLSLLFEKTSSLLTFQRISYSNFPQIVSRNDRFILHQSSDASSSSNKNDSNAYQPQMESLLEGLSRDGAAKIADMSLTERAKRAMLAEQIEDEIFARAAELDGLADEEGQIAPHHLPLARDIAAQARTLQVQYDELVSGEESSVLNALEQAMVAGGEDEYTTGTGKEKDSTCADDDDDDDGTNSTVSSDDFQ